MSRRGRPKGYRFTNQELIAALIRNKGLISRAANDLSVCATSVRNRIDKVPEVMETYNHYMESIVDDAIEQLRLEIQAGNPTLIQFALDRLGRHRGFSKQPDTVNVHGNVNQVNISNLDMTKLSYEEKKVLQKIAMEKIASEEVEAIEAEVKDIKEIPNFPSQRKE